ncbi:polysaccharide deacetylase family protein [Bacillus swezeyi]|uniref:polysaccharide deacetylase family protein n=1 Tax=Bacillus swezeyi TaxID=1925020 RepID=UPI000977A486|nr:polysaccharide deacetylase family protein [Bacillus swezeyi]MEC1259860.1 polysaccharide deacetylase family protein [Bacillus swezeyi]MED2930026.1 polysaccharide deacetylase family protein [Bacillus swezeyi]MED2944911.1 polysaccharide deacetylase family protein [Bacillus swezeyi]MED2963083.1 polysaccharide deacetylase family protein [Bacillus swezeyi]MED3074291.1 polysaccharide deacetylase family protein [Bacillus swezeyi]
MSVKPPSLRWIKALIFLTILIGLAGYSFNKVSSDTEAPQPKQGRDDAQIGVESLVSDSDEERYAVHYPVFHIKEIDDQLKTYVRDQLNRFKENNANARAQNENGPFELNIKYKIVYHTKQTAAVVLNEYIAIGSAPGKTTIKTFNADLKHKKLLALEDLFIENSDYLNKISSLAYQQLKNENAAADLALLREGTSPVEENFSRFALLEDEVEFYFEKEQTGLEQSVKIKKEQLRDILKDQYENMKKDRSQAKQKQEAVPLPKEAKVNPNGKVIALTFDDGPNPASTNKILDALKKYEGHATFFVLGSRAQVYPETVKRMMKEGNEVGNHSWDHPLLTRLSDEKAYKEIDDTQQVIEKISGHLPTHLRPPYGGINDSVRGLTNLKISLWDVDPEDWKVRNKQKIVNHVMSHAGDGKIVLMHDIYAASAEAAEEIIERLNQQGYQLVTVSQLEKVKKQRGN